MHVHTETNWMIFLWGVNILLWLINKFTSFLSGYDSGVGSLLN